MAGNASFAKKHGFPFPLLCDETRQIGLRYGACDAADAKTARRISYLIDPEGRIARVYASVNPGTHPREILGALDSSAAG